MGYLMIFLTIISIPLGIWLSIGLSEDELVDTNTMNFENIEDPSDKYFATTGGTSNGGSAYVNSTNGYGLYSDD